MQPFVIESLLTRADWTALQRVWGERQRARIGRARLLGATFAPLVVAAVFLSTQASAHEPRAFAAFLIGLCGMLGSVVATAHLYRRWSLPDEAGVILGSVRMEFSSEGIRTLRENSVAVAQWSTLKDVTRTDTHLFLWVDPLSAHIVPLRDLPEGLDAGAVIERIRGFAGPTATTDASHGAAAAADTAGAPSLTSEGRGFLSTFASRLAWRPVPADGPGSDDGMILLCGLTSVAIWLAVDRYSAGASAQWYPGGAAALTWYGAGALALAWILHRASLEAPRFRALLATIVGGLPLALALALAIHHVAPATVRLPGYALVGSAAFVYVRRSLMTMSGRQQQPLALLAGTLFAVLFAWATSEGWVYPHFWYAARDEAEESGGGWADGERLLFEQADRIDAAAARITQGHPQRADLFFVGFAGVGEQKVFAEEITLSERVVAERYAAAGRSLLLINDKRDRNRWPLATVHGLRRALARVGERMDRGEDVLFLMLTSHGSDEPALSVSNGAWPLQQLDGKALRAALDESGIRWRVIVVSACHSGAFIKPLADENTIILTSAAGDRTSFGCGDDRTLTNFGEAFIRDALPRAESLQSAFEQAKQALAERERRERAGASSPQAYVGSAISTHWRLLEAERMASRSH
jgi:hypothetical protein